MGLSEEWVQVIRAMEFFTVGTRCRDVVGQLVFSTFEEFSKLK